MIVVSKELKRESGKMGYGFVEIDRDIATLKLCRNDRNGETTTFELWSSNSGSIRDYCYDRILNKARYVRVYIPRYCLYNLVGVLRLCMIGDELFFKVRLRDDCENYKKKGFMHNELLVDVNRKGKIIAESITIYSESTDVMHIGDFDLSRR